MKKVKLFLSILIIGGLLIGIAINCSVSVNKKEIMASTLCYPYQGCTGQDTSNWTGIVYITNGTWGTTTAGTSLWTDAGSYTYLTASSSDLVVGDDSTSTAPFWIDVSTGNLAITGDFTAASGTFSGYVSGIMPTSSSHLATKEYVDLSTDVVLDYFLASSTDAGTGYLNMFDYDLDGTEQSIASSSLPASTDDQLLFTWISTTTLTKVLSSGVYTLHVQAEETGSNNNVQIYFTLATTSGAVIMTSEVSDTITDRKSVELHAALSSEVTLTSTDRLVLRIYANVGSGSSGELTIYYEGNTFSRLSVPTTAGIFSDIFLRQDGTKSLTGDWNVGGFDITGITSLNATSLTVSTGIEAATATITTITGDLTGDVTGNADTATALASDPTDCGAGTVARSIDASGNLTCSAIDISDDTNLAAGRSLTLSGDSVEADSELYVFKAKIAFEDPTADDDFFFEELNKAVTFTSIYCKTLVGTVDLDVQIAGSDINGTDITCDTDGELVSSLGGDTSGAVGEELKLAITSAQSSTTYLMVQVNGTYDD